MVFESNIHRKAQFLMDFFRVWGRTAYRGVFIDRRLWGRLNNREEIRIGAVALANICGEDSKSGKRPGSSDSKISTNAFEHDGTNKIQDKIRLY